MVGPDEVPFRYAAKSGLPPKPLENRSQPTALDFQLFKASCSAVSWAKPSTRSSEAANNTTADLSYFIILV